MIHKKRNQFIAAIGAGYWGKNLVRNFNELGVLHTVCDTDNDILEAIKQQYPDINVNNNYSELLRDPDITAVVIATPASTHYEKVRLALVAGKDVFVEKPLCLSENEATELNGLASEKEKILMVGHILWYHPAILKLQELINKGELGRIQYIYSNRLNLGKLRIEENVLWSFAPHDISVILGLLQDFPESVQAQGGNYLHQQISDTTVSLLNFSCGVRAHIFVSWLHPFKEQKLVVVGDRKMAVFDDTAEWTEKLVLFPHNIKWSGNIPIAEKADRDTVNLQETEPLKAECLHFIECLQNRQTPRTDGMEGMRVLSVLNACQNALETGKKIPLNVNLDQIRNYQIHESAVIESDVEIGRDTKIWHFSHILAGSRIGEGCTIGQNVMIGPRVTIGNGCKIQNNVSVYEGVTLEDDVFCGPSVVFTNVLNPRAHVSRKHEFKPTLIRHGVTIGANATILCGITLGNYSFIGAGAVVTKNVPNHAIMVGNPARHAGWMCTCGERLGDDLACLACGVKYDESGKGLVGL